MIGLLKRIAMLAAGLVTARWLRTSRRAATAPDPRPARPPQQRWKRMLKHWGVLLVLLAIGGFLVAASGIIPIAASSGHWGITRWFLEFSKSRSMATHSLGIAVPALNDPALVLKGAGHFESGCRPCHGAPGRLLPSIMQAATPAPPPLSSTVREWDDAELFYIVKHGIKFTGMPAWPALERDDEVWAVVAFLRVLPDLDATSYDTLVAGTPTTLRRAAQAPEPTDTDTTNTAAVVPLQALLPPETVPEAITESCGRCHGVDGLGRGTGAFPRLAGQRYPYLLNALRAYARGERHSGIMEPIATGLSPEQQRLLARYYADLPAFVPPDRPIFPSIERGRLIAQHGIPEQRVPSCVDCHGPGHTPRNPAYPVLAGQYARYLVLQLELFKEDRRGGSPYARLMDPVTHWLTPEQMRDVAAYYQALPPLPAHPPAARRDEPEE